MSNSDRYIKVDSEHILDSSTGVKYHLYDDWLKLTHDDKVVLKSTDLTPQEQSLIWDIKQLITDPVEAARLKQEYPDKIKTRRKALSDLYENPTPAVIRDPIVETDTEEYKG